MWVSVSLIQKDFWIGRLTQVAIKLLTYLLCISVYICAAYITQISPAVSLKSRSGWLELITSRKYISIFHWHLTLCCAFTSSLVQRTFEWSSVLILGESFIFLLFITKFSKRFTFLLKFSVFEIFVGHQILKWF